MSATDYPGGDFGSMSLHELFRSEAEGQVQVLTDGLLALERDATGLAAIAPLMRAAHSLKGAARIVHLGPIEKLAHGMEDCFVAAQKGSLPLRQAHIDHLLAGVDLMAQVAAVQESETGAWLASNEARIGLLLRDLSALVQAQGAPATAPAPTPAPAAAAPPPALSAPATAAPAPAPEMPAPAPLERDHQDLKVNARDFDHLLALASEARVAACALQPHLLAMQRFKKRQYEMFAALDQLGEVLESAATPAAVQEKLLSIRHKNGPLKGFLIHRLAELEAYERRLLRISQEMLDEVLSLRMRPLRDGVQALPRMVRDLARSLGKDVRLVIQGDDTPVDRDILARMENPLNHLLRNAVDHGMELPAQRLAAGKPAQGTIVLQARHSGGMLALQVQDDGQGVDLDQVRHKVVARQLASAPMAQAMSAAELLDFLLLPTFTLKEAASHLSGRGVGLDVVQTTVRQLNGSVTLETAPGQGFRTHIRLPLSQSVVRVVVAQIAGQTCALPIAKIHRILDIARIPVHTLGDAQFFSLDGEHIGLISAAQLLGLGATQPAPGTQPVILIGTGQQRYALAVDAIGAGHSLSVQSLEATFGKLRDISAAALLEDGTPVLILDVASLLVSIDKLAGEGHLQRLQGARAQASTRAKRVLVVDDSLTVREMERKLLQARGFAVDVAVDGMDGWNAVRSGTYDLVITDVDMPRLDGIELVTLIKKDQRLRQLPVMIVSYKDRPEDRARGLGAGADYYLTKGSFHDATLLDAVVDLIGDSGT